MRFLRLLPGVALLAALSASAAAPLARFLPARSYAVMQLDNSAALRERWDRSPWARTLADEEVQRFFAPMREQMKLGKFEDEIKAQTGHTLEELISLFNAPCAAAFTDVQFDLEGGKPASFGLVFVLQLGGKREMIENLLKPKPGKFTETTSEYRGVTVHEINDEAAGEDPAPGKMPHPEMFWAVVDDYWVVATPRAVVEEIVAGIQQNGLSDPFSRSALYQGMQQQAGDHALSVYVNLRSFIAEVGRLADKMVTAKSRSQPDSNPLGLTVNGVLHATGLDALDAAYMGASIGDESTDAVYNITFTEERGLTKFFATSDGKLTLPPWVRADWTNAAVLQLSMPHFLTVLEEIVGGISPGLLTMGQGQLQVMKQRTGVDLKTDIFGALGDHIVAGKIPGAEPATPDLAALQQGQNLVAISTADPKRLLTALDTLGTMGGQLPQSLFETRDYLGTKVYSVRRAPNAPPSAKQVSFAIAGGYWIISVDDSARPLESVLQSLNSGTTHGSLWEKPDVQQALHDFAPGAIGYSYQDMPALFSTMFDAFSLLQKQADATAAADAKADEDQPEETEPGEEHDKPAPKSPPMKMVDPTQQPSYELLRRYWSNSVAATWRDAHSMRTLTRISHTPAKK